MQAAKKQSWPPDYAAEFNRRFKLYAQYKANPEKMPAVWAHYRFNPTDWINDFCVTYDPRKKSPAPKLMPFMLFKRQEELVQCLIEAMRDGEGVLIEKSRDMGATWLSAAVCIHQLIFEDGFSAGWGSRKEQLVDRIGDPDSIFEKLRIILDYLPAFAKPNCDVSYMKIINRDNGSTITGEAGDNIGRGGRKTIYFKDESAHYERPDRIEAALGDTTDVQVDISSVNGTGNVFHRRREAGEIWEPGKTMPRGYTRVFVMDWRDHPDKNQAWYDARRAKAEREGLLTLFAQEVDRDYAASVEGVVIRPEWVKAAIDAHIKLGIAADGKKYGALDVADEGADKNALCGRHGVILTHCEAWGLGDTGDSTRKTLDLAREWGIRDIQYDCIGVGAGVKAEYNRLKREDDALHKDERQFKHFSLTPWNAGAGVLDPDDNIIRGDRDTPTNKDYFENLSAQALWRLAQRFYKTYMAVTKGVIYKHDELISISSDISNLHEIVKELSQVTQTASGKGKMKIVKTPSGTKSPNMADSIKMCYSPLETGVDYSKLVMM